MGGGNVAVRKARGLAAAGAAITVVAPAIDPELVDLATAIKRLPYDNGDIGGHRLVLTATDDPVVNARVAADARAAGVWVNSADDPVNCSFILPAIARHGDVSVAVSTNGSSPALASYLRARFQDDLDRVNAGGAARQLADERGALHAKGESTEDVDWSPRLAQLFDDPEVNRPEV